MFYDPVRVPDNAGEGKAKITVSFADWKTAKVASTTVEFPIVDAKADAKSKDDAKASDAPPADIPAAKGGISVRVVPPKTERFDKVIKILNTLKAVGVKNVEFGNAKPGEKTTAVIHASEDTPAGKVQKIIKALQRVGVENFKLRAKK